MFVKFAKTQNLSLLIFCSAWAFYSCSDLDPAFQENSASPIEEEINGNAVCLESNCILTGANNPEEDGDVPAGPPIGDDPNGEDPNDDDPNGEDPNGEDPNDDDPNNDDPNGDPNQPGDDDENDPDSPPNKPVITDVTELAEVCGDLSDPANFDAVTQSITFKSTEGQGCGFDSNGNLSPQDGWFRGVRSQTELFKIDATRVVCNVNLDFLKYTDQQHDMLYDDLMFLTVRSKDDGDDFDTGHLLVASTENYNEHFENFEDTDLFVFDWMKLRNQEFDRGPQRQAYCFGTETDADCEVPGHEVPGDLEVVLSDMNALILSKSILSGTELEFGFHITGDNDNSDCQHDKDFSFDVTIYYAKQK